MASTKNEWYIIVNPHAGSGKTMSLWAQAEERLKLKGIPYRTVLTTRKFHAVDLAREAAAVGYRHILAVGGDGSVHEMFSGVINYAEKNGVNPSEFYLGVIPIGSGNDWVRSTGVSHEIPKVIDLIAEESFMKQDVVLVEAEGARTYMVNVGGVGFDSNVCDRVNRLKEQGMRSKRIYFDALLHTIAKMKSFQCRVFADGEEIWSGDTYTIAVGNGRYSGGGMRQVPSALLDDGLLDFMITPKMPVKSIMPELPRLFNGTMEKSDKMMFGKCRTLEIRQQDAAFSLRPEQIVEVDGEIEGRLPVRISVTGQKINVLYSK